MRAKYSQQFKEEAVALALESDYPYSPIARDLDVNYQTFGNWIKAAMSKSSKPNDKKKTIKKDYQAAIVRQLTLLGPAWLKAS